MKQLLTAVLVALALVTRAQDPVVVPATLTFADLRLDLNAGARKKIKADAEALRRSPRFFQRKVDRADAYFPIIEAAFAEEGLPDDFKYLVLQESGLVADAVSSSKAVGFWQFKEPAAREVGLRVDRAVDERMNISAASRGAARYLKINNKHFDNWVYALLAYNTGAGGAQRYVNKKYFGARRMPITERTHWYVLKFLAHKVAFEGYVGRNETPPLVVVVRPAPADQTLSIVATTYGLDVEEVAAYNVWLRQRKIPADRPYLVSLPVPAVHPQYATLTKRKAAPAADPVVVAATAPVVPPPPAPDVRAWAGKRRNRDNEMPLFFKWNGIPAIQARQGDNAALLAMQAGISKEDFLKYNDLSARTPVEPGTLYYIKKKRRKAKVYYHVVQPGEDLRAVSQRYGVRLKLLQRKNRMRPGERVRPGQVLWLRHIRPASTPVAYETVPAPTETSDVLPKTQPSPPATTKTPAPLPKTQPAPPVATETPASASSRAEQTEPVQPSEVPPSTDRQDERVAAAEPAALPEPEQSAASAEEMPGQEVSEPPPPVPAVADPTDNDFPETVDVTFEEERTASLSEKGTAGARTLSPAPGRWAEHTVAAGETLYGIGRQHGVSVDSLQAWNQLRGAGLRVGQSLRYRNAAATTPASPAAAEPAVERATYVVQPGDTFYGLAKRFGTTAETLRRWNGKADFNLSVGERLFVGPK